MSTTVFFQTIFINYVNISKCELFWFILTDAKSAKARGWGGDSISPSGNRIEIMPPYYTHWVCSIVWIQDARKAECFNRISCFPIFHGCWYNYLESAQKNHKIMKCQLRAWIRHSECSFQNLEWILFWAGKYTQPNTEQQESLTIDFCPLWIKLTSFLHVHTEIQQLCNNPRRTTLYRWKSSFYIIHTG